MTTWVALIILALGAMLLIFNQFGVIAGLDTNTFGYLAICSALSSILAGGCSGATEDAAAPCCAIS